MSKIVAVTLNAAQTTFYFVLLVLGVGSMFLLAPIGRWRNRNKNVTMAFCPDCHEEQMLFTVEHSGEGFDQDWGKTGYAEGQGSCGACGWTGYHVEQWP